MTARGALVAAGVSRATFSDPDGNVWLLQEITTRLPGRGRRRADVVRLR